jgi:hypothetical protein
MAKKPDMKAILRIAQGGASEDAAPDQRTIAAHSKADPTEVPGVAPSRAGLVQICGYFEEPVRSQLKVLALERGASTQSLMTEALNALFVKYGKAPIAADPPKVRRGRS